MSVIIPFPTSETDSENSASLKEEILRGLDVIERSRNTNDPKIAKLREETADKLIEAVKVL